ncbi:hypothetical protein TB1_017926 [Malus domestica]
MKGDENDELGFKGNKSSKHSVKIGIFGFGWVTCPIIVEISVSTSLSQASASAQRNNAQLQPPPPQNIKVSSEDDSVPTTGSTRPFDDDGYLGYDPRLSSQRFDSESLKDSATFSPIFHGSAVNDAFATQPASEAFSPPSIYAESNGQGFDGGFGASDDPILPAPSEMLPEEGFALREWRSSWSESPYKDAAKRTASGNLPLNAFLSEWALMTLLNPKRSLANLIYVRYNGSPASAIHVTRRRSVDHKSQKTERNVFSCFIFGPKNAGKSALLNSFIGRPSSKSEAIPTGECYAVKIGVEASTNHLADQQMPVYNLALKILCQVINVSLKAEPDTDEVFAQVTLLPESNQDENAVEKEIT